MNNLKLWLKKKGIKPSELVGAIASMSILIFAIIVLTFSLLG